jgi:two-component sensor histidine kinase
VAGDASGRRLVLRWAESGGPPVAPPARTGFGTRLIRRSLAADIGGRADLDFASTGLRCTLEVPLAPGRRAEGGRR